MPHVIEEAKSGRAACRTCKEKIEKGVLRFGEEVPNQFSEGPSYQWHHLKCAATKKGAQLKEALAGYSGEVPERAELEQLIEQNKGKSKAGALPFAEKAPTGRSKCMVCEENIEKGELRIAVEAEIDTGSFVTKGQRYLHPACAPDYEGAPDDLLELVKKNSVSLSPDDVKTIEAELGGEGGGDGDGDDE
jgi:hypothetical protein